MMKPFYSFGQEVTFKYLGAKTTGVVTWSFYAGNNQYCYHVRDSCGNYRHLTEHEITAIYDGVNKEQQLYRKIVDLAWNDCTESSIVPATAWADRIIERAKAAVAA